MPTFDERLRAVEQAVTGRPPRRSLGLPRLLGGDELRKQLDAALERRTRNTSAEASDPEHKPEIVRELERQAEEKRQREIRAAEHQAELIESERRREAMIAPYRGRQQGPRIEPDAV